MARAVARAAEGAARAANSSERAVGGGQRTSGTDWLAWWGAGRETDRISIKWQTMLLGIHQMVGIHTRRTTSRTALHRNATRVAATTAATTPTANVDMSRTIRTPPLTTTVWPTRGDPRSASCKRTTRQDPTARAWDLTAKGQDPTSRAWDPMVCTVMGLVTLPHWRGLSKRLGQEAALLSGGMRCVGDHHGKCRRRTPQRS